MVVAHLIGIIHCEVHLFQFETCITELSNIILSSDTAVVPLVRR